MKHTLFGVIGVVWMVRPLQAFSPMNSFSKNYCSQIKTSTAVRKGDGADSDLEHDTYNFDATSRQLIEKNTHLDQSRRRLFLKRSLHTLTLLGFQGETASARGLARFPCKEPLLNTYHFMRAGASLLEEENVWSTNPLFLTNREAALSELGDIQVKNACRFLNSQDITPTVVRYSLAAASVDSANIVGEELKVSSNTCSSF